MKLRFSFWAVVLVVLVVSAVRADTLRLRAGRTIEGDFVDGSPRQVRFMGKDGVLKVYSITEIGSIVFGEAPAPTAGAPLSCFGPPGRPNPGDPRLPQLQAGAQRLRCQSAPSLPSR